MSSAVAGLRPSHTSRPKVSLFCAVAGLRPSHTSRPKVSLFVYRPAEGAGAFGWAVNDSHAKLNRFAAPETCGRTWGGVGDPRPARRSNPVFLIASRKPVRDVSVLHSKPVCWSGPQSLARPRCGETEATPHRRLLPGVPAGPQRLRLHGRW